MKGRKITKEEITARRAQCSAYYLVDGSSYMETFLPGKNNFIGKLGYVDPSFPLGELALEHPQGVHDTFVELPHIDLNAIEF